MRKKLWNWSSAEPVKLISDEIFTVVFADDQDTVSNITVNTNVTSSGDGASSPRTETEESADASPAWRHGMHGSGRGNARRWLSVARRSARGRERIKRSARSEHAFSTLPARGSTSSQSRGQASPAGSGSSILPRRASPGSPGGTEVATVIGPSIRASVEASTVDVVGNSADGAASTASAPASSRRRPPTPEKLRDVIDLYPPETLPTVNPIRMTRARGRGRGGSEDCFVYETLPFYYITYLIIVEWQTSSL
jgi:hypothetical protein